MLHKYTKKELKDKMNFIFYDMAGGEGGVECWLDLYRKEYRSIYNKKPSYRELFKYILNIQDEDTIVNSHVKTVIKTLQLL